MKINPISVNYCKRSFKQSRHEKHLISDDATDSVVKTSDLSFKGKGGSIGCVVGTFAGLGLGTLATLATGGIALPLLLSAGGCAAGGIAGDEIYDRLKKNKNKSKD